MAHVARAEQTGFTTCIEDDEGHLHCFRIDKEIGAELVKMVNEAVSAKVARKEGEHYRRLTD